MPQPRQWRLIAAFAFALGLAGAAAAFGFYRLNQAIDAYAHPIAEVTAAAKQADETNTWFITRHKVLKDVYLFVQDPERIDRAASEVAAFDAQVDAGLAALRSNPVLQDADRQAIDNLQMPLQIYRANSRDAIGVVRVGGDPFVIQQVAVNLTYAKDRPVSAALTELSETLNRRAQTLAAEAHDSVPRALLVAGGVMLASLLAGLAVGFIAIAHDRARRQRAEHALGIRDRALAAASCGVVITAVHDTNNTAIYVNPAFCNLTGYQASEFLGASPGMLAGAGTDRATVEAMLAAKAAGEESVVTVLHYRKDGTPYWSDLALSPVRTESGQITHWVSIHTDATARVEAEQQQEARAQTEKLRALGQMASGMAHDLNQSLTLIASHCEVGRRELAGAQFDVAELQELFTICMQAALDGGQTLKRLLLFGRTHADTSDERVDLEALVREVADLTAPRWRDMTQAEGRPVSLYVESSGEPVVVGPRPQLREALTNLIFNAVDALPRGGTIRIVASQLGDQAFVNVIDDGVGMPPEVRKRIFEPFFTTKGEQGTGLGMAMVFGVVERLGGTIDIDSTEGGGTRVRMGLRAAAPQAASATQPEVVAAPRSDRETRLRLLVVDDEPGITRSVVRLLRPLGHAVTCALSGEEAVEQLSHQSFDVVLSDLGLGAGMNGWELAGAVREKWSDTRFILATGWGASIDPEDAHTRGVASVLAKPYRPEELFTALGLTHAA